MNTIKLGLWRLWEMEKEGTRELGIWEGLAGRLLCSGSLAWALPGYYGWRTLQYEVLTLNLPLAR